jgi:SpoIID/LytB domain protein
MRKIGFVLFFIFVLLLVPFIIRADELEDVTKLLEQSNKELASTTANYQKISDQLKIINQKLIILEEEIKQKEIEVKKGEQVLDYQKKLLNERARVYYKNIGKNTVNLLNLLVLGNLSQSLDNFFYQKTIVDEDRKTIIKIVLYIKNLEEKKKNLEEEKITVATLKQEADKQSKQLAEKIGEIKQTIASLTARQQQLIAQKLASLNISRSASTLGRCDSDLTNGRDPGFSPRFAFFTYGVPNRVGLNQYGAYGRAKAGQGEEEILRAYYNFDSLGNADTGITIRVEGVGDYSLEEYVKRVYEVPDSWGNDGFAALKAQAIAARSYALAYTNNGQGSICATEQCQVVHAEPKGGNWERAVNETNGKVMIKNGAPIKAWFSSTHGGYIFSSGEIGWSATDWTKHGVDTASSYNNFNDLNNNAYDRESPWFYCDWGSRSEYNKTAWLKTEELADIVNVVLLARQLSSDEKEHLYQTDKPNPAGKETWDREKVKSELKNRGSQFFNSINEGSVNADFGYGKTTAVNFSGDGGSVTIDATEFKNWFNLRAPANIQIVGPLFNVEKR